MSDAINTPDIDAANEGSLAGGLDAFLAAWMRDNLDDMLPAVVVSYDESSNRAVLRPLVMIGTTDGAKRARASVSNVPVFRYGGGGFFLRLPVKPGDFGWLKANDRDISLVMQRGGQQDWPNTVRRHNFSDAMFFPDSLKGWTVAGGDADALTLQSLDGATCIAIGTGTIELRAGGQVLKIDASGVKHNGVNIGGTHTHGGVEPGGGTTGGPS